MSVEMSGNDDGRMPSGRHLGQGDQLEAVDYISSNLGTLAFMARRHRLETLGYLIDMARMEAEKAIKALRTR